MTLFTILFALFVERVLQLRSPLRSHVWFDTYLRAILGFAATRPLLGQPWGAALALLPPLLGVAWLQSATSDLGALFQWAFGALVLLYSLGPGDIGDDAESFIDARDAGQDERATAIAQSFCLSEVPDDEPRRSLAVARAVVVLACPRLVGPIFWFVVFGAVGAAGYRMIVLLAGRARQDAQAPVSPRGSETLRRLADWAPARVTAAGYAIGGNFDAVAHAWRTFDQDTAGGPLTAAEQLLATTGLAALDTFPQDAEEINGATVALGGLAIPPVVEDALALVWRSLVLWVTVIAGGSLVAAIA